MAVDIFAKIGDIKGESLDDRHKEEIDVLSFSWGLTSTGGGGAAAGKATFHDLSFTHHIDKASPKLLEACATGAHLKDAVITHRKAGGKGQEFLLVRMTDVIITGVTHGGSSDQSGAENVTLQFAKVDFEYRPQRPDGVLEPGIHFKYDLKANKIG